MPPKKKKYDRLKVLKKISRQSNKVPSRGGYHMTQKDRPRVRRSTNDYLSELDTEDE